MPQRNRESSREESTDGRPARADGRGAGALAFDPTAVEPDWNAVSFEAVGHAYIAALGGAFDVDDALRNMQARVSEAYNEQHVRGGRPSAKVLADFLLVNMISADERNGRFVTFAGWRLTRAEAELAALVALRGPVDVWRGVVDLILNCSGRDRGESKV